MKKINKKAFVPLALLIALSTIPMVMASDTLGVTVDVTTPHVLPATGEILLATGLGFPILLFMVKYLFEAKSYNDVAWVLVALLIAMALVAVITNMLAF